jgi:glycosyltransferase involved in cell wall biosynthesis
MVPVQRAGGLGLVRQFDEASASAVAAPRAAPLDAKRVLMVTEALARGGAERQMLALTQGLLSRDYRVEVLELIGVVPGQASFIDEFRVLGLEPKHVAYMRRSAEDERAGAAVAAELQPYAEILPDNASSICSALAAIMSRFQPGIVYCWSDLANFLGGFTAAANPVLRTILGQRTFPPPFWVEPSLAEKYRQAHRALLSKPNMTMINISAASAKAYETWLGIDETVKVVRNGFDPSSIRIPENGATRDFRRRLGIPDDAPVVGTVIRFAPEKDPHLWLQAAAAIAAARPDAHFILNGYGHGDIAIQLRVASERLGLRNRLHMPAVIADVGRVYGAISVFLLTSRTDATPNALIEAQALGLPVVAPDIGGIEETMLDGVTGILVRERSADALAAAVLQLLDEPSRRETARINGPIFVAERFGLDRMIDETIAIATQYRAALPLWGGNGAMVELAI